MFAPRPGPEQYVSVSDNLEGNAPLDNFHIDLNFGTYQLQGAAEPPLTCWTTRLTDEEMACIYPSTTDQPLRSFSLVPMEYREPASYSILPTKDSLGGFSSQPSISPSTERQATAVAPPQAQVISPGNSAAVAPHQTQAISSSNSTASKDFSCPRCGTLFGRRDNMSRHMKKPCPSRLVSTPTITVAAPQNGATKRQRQDVSQGSDEEYDREEGAEVPRVGFVMKRKRRKELEEDLAGMKERLRKAEEDLVRAEERLKKSEEDLAETKERLEKAEERFDFLLRK